MKDIIEKLQQDGKLYIKFLEVTPKEIGIRNRLRLFYGEKKKGVFDAFIIVSQKSRVLSKDGDKYFLIFEKLSNYVGHTFDKKYLFINAPLCSKADKLFRELGWSVEVDVTL